MSMKMETIDTSREHVGGIDMSPNTEWCSGVRGSVEARPDLADWGCAIGCGHRCDRAAIRAWIEA